ncbi:MAG: ATP-binding cassette domain-containing protein [Ruminococcus sp.]|jgi:ABC-2 type transport system ATP-binding protein|nr:ATP-binding cassette domain-containing protein [Ruminococcus sp.]
MALITVENLVKTYTTYKRGSDFRETVKSFFHREKITVNAVNDISFGIPEGQLCGLLGPNGAGKSTTVKMLCGALFPTSGRIISAGYSPAAERGRYVKEIGAVFGQKSQLIFDIPPEDSFNLNRAIYDIPKADYNERLAYMTKLLDVEDVIKKPTRVLSLGERMKCEFIMAMLHAPKIVFLDEPTIGLDVIAKASVREFIANMNKQGTTFILTTHDLDDVCELARRVIIINKGEKVFDGELENLRNYLGRKKVIELTLSERLSGHLTEVLPEAVRKAILASSFPSELQLTLEADMDIMPINQFIEHLAESIKFTDISVKELPMERIIADIYKS